MNKLINLQNPLKEFNLLAKLIMLGIIFIFSQYANSQNNVERYNIGEIKVSGNTSFSPITIVTFSGLRKGDAISIPGEKLSNAIKEIMGVKPF